jgi:hypothetical protein
VTEMDTALEKLLHADYGHGVSSLMNVVLSSTGLREREPKRHHPDLRPDVWNADHILWAIGKYSIVGLDHQEASYYHDRGFLNRERL